MVKSNRDNRGDRDNFKTILEVLRVYILGREGIEMTKEINEKKLKLEILKLIRNTHNIKYLIYIKKYAEALISKKK